MKKSNACNKSALPNGVSGSTTPLIIFNYIIIIYNVLIGIVIQYYVLYTFCERKDSFTCILCQSASCCRS